jgi:SacI restriction endonuclease
MRLDRVRAAEIIREQAARLKSDKGAPQWIIKVERLSQLCETGISKTHIAFLGTAMLAKTLDLRADLFAIKPTHARDNAKAFSARTLSHSVLVPLAAELGINLGVTGREPLNNQPYFRMERLDDGTPVHAGGRAAFDYMLSLVRELQELRSQDQALGALGAFIGVRMGYQPRYVEREGASQITPERLTAAIQEFVRTDSEHGKRAQAIVAGLLDVFASPAGVESGRINDPSRKYPGDVCVRSIADADIWEKAFEVRDKPVAMSDVQIFGKKCVDMHVREAAVVMVSDRQPKLDDTGLAQWAGGFGLGLTLFHGWPQFVDQALFWSKLPKFVAAGHAVCFIHARLVAVEALPASVALWDRLTQGSP